MTHDELRDRLIALYPELLPALAANRADRTIKLLDFAAWEMKDRRHLVRSYTRSTVIGYRSRLAQIDLAPITEPAQLLELADALELCGDRAAMIRLVWAVNTARHRTFAQAERAYGELVDAALAADEDAGDTTRDEDDDATKVAA